MSVHSPFVHDDEIHWDVRNKYATAQAPDNPDLIIPRDKKVASYRYILYLVWQDEAKRANIEGPSTRECKAKMEAVDSLIEVIDRCYKSANYGALRSEVREFVVEQRSPAELQQAIDNFILDIEPAIRSVAEGDVGLHTWEPEGIPADYMSHFQSLEIPCISAQKNFPSLLLHELGTLVEQVGPRQCIDQIFGSQITYLCNAAGAGKTRLLLEGLTLHWGFYFTLARDTWGVGSGDWKDALDSIGLSGIRKTLPNDPGGDDPQSLMYEGLLEKNKDIVRRHVYAVLWARLLVFRVFLKYVPSSVTAEEEALYRRRWLLLQVDPCILPDHPDFDVFFHLAKTIREIYVSDTVTPVVRASLDALAQAVLPAMKGTQSTSPLAQCKKFVVVIDEAQMAARMYQDAFRSDTRTASTDGVDSGSSPGGEKTKHRPLLRQLLVDIAQVVNSRPVHLLPTGTSISQAEFQQAVQSAIAKDTTSQRTARYTGGIRSMHDVETYAKRLLPASFLAGESGQRLLHRMFMWLPGRFRFMARFLTFLMINGLRSPHGLLNSFVYTYTEGYLPTDAGDMLRHEPAIPLSFLQRWTEVQIDFDRIKDNEVMYSQVLTIAREPVCNYILKSSLKLRVSSEDSPLLVEVGFARYDIPDDTDDINGTPREAAIDEPLIILRLSTWFDSRPHLTMYNCLAHRIGNTDSSGGNNGWENYIAHCLVRAFSQGSVPLSTIFTIRKSQASKFGDLMGRSAKIVRVIRLNSSPVDARPLVGVTTYDRRPHSTSYADDPGRPRFPSVNLGVSAGDGPDSEENGTLRKYEQTLEWLQTNPTPLYFPDTNFGPDIVMVLQLDNGELCWLVVQCKKVSSIGKKFKVPSSHVAHALHSVTPANFFMSKKKQDKGNVDQNEAKKNERACKILRDLPQRTSLAGDCSVIRAVALFPGPNYLDKVARDEGDSDSHPLVEVNFDHLKDITRDLTPNDILQVNEEAESDRVQRAASKKKLADNKRANNVQNVISARALPREGPRSKHSRPQANTLRDFRNRHTSLTKATPKSVASEASASDYPERNFEAPDGLALGSMADGESEATAPPDTFSEYSTVQQYWNSPPPFNASALFSPSSGSVELLSDTAMLQTPGAGTSSSLYPAMHRSPISASSTYLGDDLGEARSRQASAPVTPKRPAKGMSFDEGSVRSPPKRARQDH
ncbi:hypothetical protein BD626DRAFT_534761 [Schizophyllum amplum]|uniref:Uncharacterized protein n=1 Tax=Schizophyllum amplum TaxID=97359 RepID=A0A550CP40_9AGAR|nr:hypothetical protein BD626DRAFT_534761 [Auriculariopsis ampla]